jgi:hypothetical protein
MADKEVLDAIEKRILETREQKEDEQLTQVEWDREYLYLLFINYVKETVAELMAPPLVDTEG